MPKSSAFIARPRISGSKRKGSSPPNTGTSDDHRTPFVPEHTLEWFWTLIESAQGDREKLRQLAAELPKEDLKDAYDFFMTLASFVMSEDEDEDRAGDLANWTVAQGKQFYFDAYKHGKPPPPDAPTRHGAGFLGMLGRVYWERFREELP